METNAALRRKRQLGRWCQNINWALAQITSGHKADELPIEVELFRPNEKYQHWRLMQDVGLIERLRKGGTSVPPSSRPRPIYPSVYRVYRKHITTEELTELIDQLIAKED